MAKRGDVFRSEMKLRIISYILKNGKASFSALAAELSVSRVTLSSLIEELIDREIICGPHERSYAFNESLEAVMLKIGRSTAEITCFSFGDMSLKRISLRQIPSMSYSDNVARLLGTTEEYANELILDGKKLLRVLVCYDKLTVKSIPPQFSLFDGKSLVALGSEKKYSADEAVLYLDAHDGVSYLSLSGNSVLRGSCDELSENKLAVALSFMNPDRVALAGADSAFKKSAELAALKSRVRLSIIDENELRPDELAALLKVMEKQI